MSATANKSETKQIELSVIQELGEQRVKLVRVQRSTEELHVERQQLTGHARTGPGLIAEAKRRRLAEQAAAIADGRAPALEEIDKDLALLEARLVELDADLRAHASAEQQLANLRRQTLVERHVELDELAREISNDGEDLIAAAANAARAVEVYRGKVSEAVSLGASGLADAAERRAYASSFHPWVAPRGSEGRTPIGNPVPGYWESVGRVAAPPLAPPSATAPRSVA